MRKYISEKNKQRIRLFKKLNPKAICRETTEYIMPYLIKDGWIGKAPHKSTISDIINDKEPLAEKIIESAKDKIIKSSATELANITKNRLDFVNKAEAKVLKELNNKLNTDEGRVSKELISMLKDLTDIRGKILGTVELSIEAEGDPSKVENLQLVEDLLNEIETKTKIKTKITAIRPDPTPRTKEDNNPTETERAEDSSSE